MKVLFFAVILMTMLSCTPNGRDPLTNVLSVEEQLDSMPVPVVVIAAKPSRWDGWFIVRDGVGNVHGFMNNYAYAFVDIGTVIRTTKVVKP